MKKFYETVTWFHFRYYNFQSSRSEQEIITDAYASAFFTSFKTFDLLVILENFNLQKNFHLRYYNLQYQIIHFSLY